jgi:hypothetical protein
VRWGVKSPQGRWKSGRMARGAGRFCKPSSLQIPLPRLLEYSSDFWMESQRRDTKGRWFKCNLRFSTHSPRIHEGDTLVEQCRQDHPHAPTLAILATKSVLIESEDLCLFNATARRIRSRGLRSLIRSSAAFSMGRQVAFEPTSPPCPPFSCEPCIMHHLGLFLDLFQCLQVLV